MTLATGAGGPPARRANGSERTPPWLGRLAFWSAASALAALVPVPFLDEHLVRVTRRRMVRELARERGLALRETEVQLLAGLGPGFPWGCALVVSVAFRSVRAVLRRLFRTVFFWLALADASKTASFTFHEGFLLRRALLDLEPQALETVAGAADPSPRPEVKRLRACVERVVSEVDPRPVRQAFRRALRGSYQLTRATARRLRRVLLGVREEEAEARALEEAVPPSLVDGLARALAAQNPYLDDLTRRIERALAEPAEEPPTTPAEPIGSGE